MNPHSSSGDGEDGRVSVSWALAILLASTLTACRLFSPRPDANEMPWTAGRATPELAHEIEGTLLANGEHVNAVLLELPGIEPRRLDLPAGTKAVSGPDDVGSIAMLVDGWLGRYSVQLLHPDGRMTKVHAGRDIRPWATLALAPRGGLIAFAYESTAKGSDGSRELVLLDPHGAPAIPIARGIPPQRPVWVLAGQALAWVTRDARFAPDGEPNVVLQRVGEGPPSPLCRAVRIAQGRDDRHLLATDADGAFEIDVQNGRIERLGALPGDVRILGLTPDGIVIHEALATRDEDVEVECFSLMSPVHSWTVKATDPGSGRFCTLLPKVRLASIDYRISTSRP